jgi:hypothetical protein
VPPSANPTLSSGVVLCIDDNQDVLECENPMPLGMSTIAQTNGPWSANVELCFQPNR